MNNQSNALHTPEPWQQGEFLRTLRNSHYGPTAIEDSKDQESRRVFINFTEKDDGRSRTLVAVFGRPEDAARAIVCVNACAGMDDPAAEIQMMRLQYKNVSGLLRAAEAQRDALAETLVSIRAMVDNHKPGQSGITMSQIYDRAGRALAKLDGGK